MGWGVVDSHVLKNTKNEATGFVLSVPTMASLLISPDDSELTLLEHSANFFPDSLGNEPFSTIPDLLNAMCHPPFDTFPVRGKLAQPPPISPHLSQTHDFHPNNYVRVVFDMV